MNTTLPTLAPQSLSSKTFRPQTSQSGAKDLGCQPVDGFQRTPEREDVNYVNPSEFRAIMKAMPKTELHTHVEGAVRPETILDLAGQYNVELPAKTVDELKEKIGMRPGEDLLDFLKKFDCFRFVFDRPETLQRLAYECIEDNALENVKYTELRINPYKKPENVSVGQVLDSVLAGMEQAKKDYGVEAKLIASINRSHDVERAMQVAQAAVERKDRGIVGLDLAGDEVHNPPEKFTAVFDYARDNGLHVTVHAGEAVGPESIDKAVSFLGAERIGHGVRAQESEATVQMLKDKGITLEMCPTSNNLLNVVADMKSYPCAKYHHNGVKVTINTDDRHIFGVTLSDEYTRLASETGLTLSELEKISRQGLESSFLPEKQRSQELAKFDQQMLAFTKSLPSQRFEVRQTASTVA